MFLPLIIGTGHYPSILIHLPLIIGTFTPKIMNACREWKNVRRNLQQFDDDFFLYSCSLLKYGNDSQFCYEQGKKSSNHSLESGMSLYSSGVLFIFMLWQNVVSRVFTTLTIVIRKPFVNSDIYNMMMIPGPSSVTQRTKNLKRWVIFQDFCPLCSNGQLYINTV